MSSTCTLIPGTRCDGCEAQLWPDDAVGHVHLDDEQGQDTGDVKWLCAECYADLRSWYAAGSPPSA
jgi:hypothetical protein